MKRDSETELARTLPDGVVVVNRIEAEYIEPMRLVRVHPTRGLLARLSNRTQHTFGQCHRLEADVLAVLELGNCLGRVVHRNDSGRRHAISERPVDRGEVVVVATTQSLPYFGFVDA